MIEIESGKPLVYVSAFFCQDVIKENGILTAIRISDAFTAEPSGAQKKPDGSEFTTYGPIKIKGVFIFRCEQAVSFTAKIKIASPASSTYVERFSTPVSLRGDMVEPHVLNMASSLDADVEGAYWFEVYVDDRLATKAALYVMHRDSELYKRLENQKREHQLAS